MTAPLSSKHTEYTRQDDGRLVPVSESAPPVQQAQTMTCACRSSNQPESHLTRPEVVVQPPFQEKTVCLDACIAEAIQALWAAGIVTRGSCCGHGGADPSVVLDDGASDAVAQQARDLLRKDGRDWSVLAWRLIQVPQSAPSVGQQESEQPPFLEISRQALLWVRDKPAFLAECFRSFARSAPQPPDGDGGNIVVLYRRDFDTLLKSSASSVAAAPASHWLPMDSVPKDGTMILAWDSGRHFVATWHTYQMYWLEAFSPDGLVLNPTHWLPLPPPPALGDTET